jgi:hypothetical protein
MERVCAKSPGSLTWQTNAFVAIFELAPANVESKFSLVVCKSVPVRGNGC